MTLSGISPGNSRSRSFRRHRHALPVAGQYHVERAWEDISDRRLLTDW